MTIQQYKTCANFGVRPFLLLLFFSSFFKAIKQQLTFFLTVYVFGSCFRTLAVILISDYFYVDEYVDVLIHERRLHLT